MKERLTTMQHDTVCVRVAAGLRIAGAPISGNIKGRYGYYHWIDKVSEQGCSYLCAFRLARHIAGTWRIKTSGSERVVPPKHRELFDTNGLAVLGVRELTLMEDELFNPETLKALGIYFGQLIRGVARMPDDIFAPEYNLSFPDYGWTQRAREAVDAAERKAGGR